MLAVAAARGPQLGPPLLAWQDSGRRKLYPVGLSSGSESIARTDETQHYYFYYYNYITLTLVEANDKLDN